MSETMIRKIAAAVLSFASAAWAQLPWSAVTVNSSTTNTSAAILSTGAVMQFPGPDGTRVVIVPTVPVSRVILRRDCAANGEVYAPHLMGLKVDANWLAPRSDFDWQGDEAELDLSFPGLAFAPLIGQYSGGTGWLVADTDLKRCRVLYTRYRLALEYRFNPPLQPGQQLELNTIVASAVAHDGRAAMGNLLTRWRNMVPDDGEYPELQTLNGYLHVALQDQDQPLEHAARLWADHHWQFGRMQFWGWTSNKYPTPGEQTGCCLFGGTLHLRYRGLDELEALITSTGGQAARYFRADDPNLDELLTAIGNTPRYIDVAGFRSFVRRSYGPNTIIEGVTAACDDAGLAAGSVTGGTTRLTGGVRAYETPVPWFGRLVFSKRPLFLGDSNFDWHWTDEGENVCPQCRTRHAYQTYRAAFLLGCKLDVRDPSKAIVQEIVAEWDRSKFWAANPQYLDTQGITSIPAGVNVSRFLTAGGKTLLAVDQWPAATARTITVDGRSVDTPAKALSIVEIQ